MINDDGDGESTATVRKSDDALEIPGVLKRERKRKEHPTGESASSFS
jgi:hypothetical protein